MIKIAKDIKYAAARGREDWGWFMRNVLDVTPSHYWSKMEEMNISGRDNERTAVGAGHGVSKTYTLGRVALTYLYCYYPATVVTTAPTSHQVKDLLWREIRQAHAAAKLNLGGEVTTMGIDLQRETGVKWFATGFSTKPDTVTREATAFQGYHNDHLLILFDEAAGIAPEIWRAAEHIGAHKRFIGVGNPTAGVGEFANALKDPTYHQINIAVTDTPNFKERRTVIPGLYGVEYERRIRTKYGVDSDEYRVRVKGLVSQKAVEGAYYGNVMTFLHRQGRITSIPHDRNYPVYVIIDPGYTTAMWFVQSIGMTIRCIRYHEDMGQGMGDYARLFTELQRDEHYEYAKIIVPSDLGSNATRIGSVKGETALETLQSFRFDVEALPMEQTVIEGIERTEKFLYGNVFIDKDLCERGIECLEAYHEKKNKLMSTEEKLVTTGKPEKDGFDHGADGMRYVSMAAKRNMFVSGAAVKSQWKAKKAEHEVYT